MLFAERCAIKKVVYYKDAGKLYVRGWDEMKMRPLFSNDKEHRLFLAEVSNGGALFLLVIYKRVRVEQSA